MRPATQIMRRATQIMRPATQIMRPANQIMRPATQTCVLLNRSCIGHTYHASCYRHHAFDQAARRTCLHQDMHNHGFRRMVQKIQKISFLSQKNSRKLHFLYSATYQHMDFANRADHPYAGSLSRPTAKELVTDTNVFQSFYGTGKAA